MIRTSNTNLLKIKLKRPKFYLTKASGKLLLLIFLIQGICFKASAQSLDDLINFEVKNQSLDLSLQLLDKISHFHISFNVDIVNKYPNITVEKGTRSVSSTLNLLLAETNLNYVLKGENLVIIEKDSIKRNSTNKKSTVIINGTVVDRNQQTIPGVKVAVKGMNVLTATDPQGKFHLKVASAEKIILVFSFIGMEKKELVYQGENELKVELAEGSYSLSQVVVTGYQTIDKTRIAGAVSYVNAKDLYLNGVNTLEQALQGMLPGVVITNTSGLTGVRQKTTVRGTSTLTGSQDPVWVVDEVIQEDPLPFNTQTFNSLGEITSSNFDYIRNYVGNAVSWLNPNEIESVTVLKDASATAIYGVRAANGVIVIKTKRGKEGAPYVTYSMGINYGERVNYSQLGMMNSKERVDVSREIYDRGLIASWTNNNIGYAGALNQYLNKEITYDELNAKVAKLETTNTDWFKLLYRNPISQNHSASISGGSENVRYAASFGYNSTQGTAIGNGSLGYTGRIGLDMTVSPKLKVSFNLNGSQNTTSGFNIVNPYKYASTTNRSIEAYDDNGDPSFYRTASRYLFNFENERDQSGSGNKVLGLSSSLNVNYSLTKNIKIQSLFGIGASSSNGNSYATERTEYIAKIRWFDYGTATAVDDAYKGSRLPRGGEYNMDNNNSNRWSWRNTVSFDKLINNVHALTAMLGVDISSVKYRGFSTTQYGYLRDRGESFATVPLTYSTSTPNILYIDNFKRKITDRSTNSIGSYLTLNYAYDNRYVANLSIRTDASNRFGKSTNENFNPIWAGGLRWNVTREKWFKPNPWVSDLSLRASLGYQRNMATNYSPNLIIKIPIGSASSVIDVNTGEDLLTISSLPYEDLRWEKTISTNYGIDLSLIDSKVRMSFDVYKKIGTDMIVTLQVPKEYGVDNMSVNGGSMRNIGYELTLGFTPVRTKNFTWNVTLNTSKNTNSITKVGIQNPTWRTATSGNLHKEGYPASAFWAFRYTGIDQATGYPIVDMSSPAGSDPKNDPTVYMEYVGTADPDFTGGLSNSFRYKSFTLSTSFYLQLGGKKFLLPAYESTTLPSEYENLTSELNNRWRPGDTHATFPGLPDKNVQTKAVLVPGTTQSYVTAYEMYNYSTARVVNASTLRCNNISLSYMFPTELAKKLSVKNLSVSASISQPFAFVSKDFKGRDAEVSTGAQPRTRSYSLNFNITL